jgi:methionine-rich copper-binding protein CopC
MRTIKFLAVLITIYFVLASAPQAFAHAAGVSATINPNARLTSGEAAVGDPCTFPLGNQN